MTETDLAFYASILVPLAGMTLYTFCKWLAATPEPHTPRTVDAYYSYGRQGSTDWDRIPESVQL